MTVHEVDKVEKTSGFFNKTDLFAIESTFASPRNNDASFDLFVVSLEQLLEQVIPKSVYERILKQQDALSIEKCFYSLNKNLPFFYYSFSEQAPYILYITIVAHSQYTHGVGRYLNDMFSRWLIPGKQLPVVGGRSMDFRFLKCRRYRYYLHENFVRISDKNDLTLVKNNLSKLIQELKINISAVYHARYIASLKALSDEQKSAMIEENISSLIKIPVNREVSVFDKMQQLLFTISSDEKIQQVKNNITYLMHTRPKTFDRDVFYEVRHYLFLLKDYFISNREPRHISRIIAFQYLFKKSLTRAIRKTLNERHLSLKLFKAHLTGKNQLVLGILVAINFLNDSERFDKRHILEAIQSLICNVKFVENSYIYDQGDAQIRTFYFEVKKPNNKSFLLDEIKKLRKKLPQEIKTRVESVIHPIFMPRNEEEVIRNIVVLSKQLKYAKDLPQVIITYDKQSESKLSFLVICLRLIKKNTKPLKDLFQKASSSLLFSLDDKKIVGYLKRKYPKEANIFRVSCDKTPFFRKDYSLDLQKARQKIVSKLVDVIGSFRDYNGGMIFKQSEVLDHLRKSLAQENIENDYILENFFYSLKPGIMQSLLNPELLKIPFKMLLQCLEHDYDQELHYIKVFSDQNYFIIFVSAISSKIKDEVHLAISQVKLDPSDLVYSYLNIHDITTLTYIYKAHDPALRKTFYKAILKGIDLWNQKFQCFIDSN